MDKYQFRKKIGKNWYTKRLVEEWNKLSRHVIEANTTESLIRRLDAFMDVKEIW